MAEQITYAGPWQLLPFGKGFMWSPPVGCLNAIDLRPNTEQDTPGTGIFVLPAGVDPGPDFDPIGAGPLSEIFPKEEQRKVFASRIGVATVSGDTWADWIWTALSLHADIRGEVSSKPLMPTHDGLLELHLHGLVMGKRFDLGMEEAAPVIAAIKEQYRDYRQASLDGKDGADGKQYLRILDAWGNKFKVNNPQDVFVPSDLPKEAPLPHATTIQDDFDRANSALSLGTATGPNSGFTYSTTTVVGTSEVFGINTVQAYITAVLGSAPTAYADTALSSSDMLSQIDIGATTFSYWGPAVRSDKTLPSTSQNQYYGQSGTPGDNNLYFSKRVAGTGSNVVNSAQTFSAGDTQKMDVSGSSVKRYRNGSQVGTTTTDTSLSAGTYAGFFIGTASTSDRLDNFRAEDLAAGASGRGLFGNSTLNGLGSGGPFFNNQLG